MTFVTEMEVKRLKEIITQQGLIIGDLKKDHAEMRDTIIRLLNQRGCNEVWPSELPDAGGFED